MRPTLVSQRLLMMLIASITPIAAIAAITVAPDIASAQNGTPQLLTQVQAADALADLITYTVARADARIANVEQYFKETGQDAEYAKSPPPAANPLLPFNSVYRAAVLFVQQGDGAKFADPSLKTLNDAQLSDEMTELQVYNIQQFQKLNEQAKRAASMREFLKSKGELEKYQAWAKSKGFHPRTAPKTPEEAAARMEEMVGSAREIAWTKAQARGMRREEFDKRWAEQVKEYRDSVQQKVVGCRALAQSLTNPPPPPPPPPAHAPPVNVGTPPGGLRGGGGSGGGGPSLPPPVGSQYQSNNSAAAIQARNDELWNRYDDDD